MMYGYAMEVLILGYRIRDGARQVLGYLRGTGICTYQSDEGCIPYSSLWVYSRPRADGRNGILSHLCD